MANFTLSNTPPALFPGGPPNRCAICKFEGAYPWYLIFEGTFVEEPLPTFNGTWTEHTFMLCSDHATELKSTLDEVLPDKKLAATQGKLLQAEAARARAEKRAAAAEAALAAMQDLEAVKAEA